MSVGVWWLTIWVGLFDCFFLPLLDGSKKGLEGEGVYHAATLLNATHFSGWAYIGTQNGVMM